VSPVRGWSHGSGLLAIPVLAGSASFAIAELRGWRSGLDQKPRRAKRFYAVFAASVALKVVLDVVSTSPMKMLFYSAILNGVAAPPLLVVIMLLANNRKAMDRWTNSRTLNVMRWTATALMGARRWRCSQWRADAVGSRQSQSPVAGDSQSRPVTDNRQLMATVGVVCLEGRSPCRGPCGRPEPEGSR